MSTLVCNYACSFFGVVFEIIYCILHSLKCHHIIYGSTNPRSSYLLVDSVYPYSITWRIPLTSKLHFSFLPLKKLIHQQFYPSLPLYLVTHQLKSFTFSPLLRRLIVLFRITSIVIEGNNCHFIENFTNLQFNSTRKVVHDFPLHRHYIYCNISSLRTVRWRPSSNRVRYFPLLPCTLHVDPRM